MAFKKTLAQRLFNISKISNKGLTNCRISTSTAQFPIPSSTNQESIAPDPGDNGIFRRFLHKRVIPAELPALPIGGNLMEKLKSMSIGYARIRLDGLAPPPVEASPEARIGLTVQEAKKLLRVAQLEAVKSRLREMEKSWISYSEFVRICGEGCLNPDEGRSVAKMLDESGTVIVLGNAVFLKPELASETLLLRQI